MQKEIEMLVMAIHHEQARERQLLDSIMTSIAVRGAARKKMTLEIAEALSDAANGEYEDAARRNNMATEIENVIHMMRRRAA